MIPELSGKLIRVDDVLAALAGDSYMPKRVAAKYLGMSCRKLEGFRGIERYRIGGMLYFRRSVLDEFMRAHVEIREQEQAPRAEGLRCILPDGKKARFGRRKEIAKVEVAKENEFKLIGFMSLAHEVHSENSNECAEGADA